MQAVEDSWARSGGLAGNEVEREKEGAVESARTALRAFSTRQVSRPNDRLAVK